MLVGLILLMLRRLVLLVLVVVPGSLVHGLSILPISGIPELCNVKHATERFLRVPLLEADRLRLLSWSNIYPGVAL